MSVNLKFTIELNSVDPDSLVELALCEVAINELFIARGLRVIRQDFVIGRKLTFFCVQEYPLDLDAV